MSSGASDDKDSENIDGNEMQQKENISKIKTKKHVKFTPKTKGSIDDIEGTW